jgi:hypothetical protein
LKLLFIIGETAVGKMTVGQELMKITDLRLFYNHLVVEPVVELFGEKRLDTVLRLRTVFFEDFAASDMYGIICTNDINFNKQGSLDYINWVIGFFDGADVYFAELCAPLEVRIQRSKTENRLAHKPSMKNLEQMEKYMRDKMNDRNGDRGEVPFENYIKIDNTDLPPDAVARMIKERFCL